MDGAGITPSPERAEGGQLAGDGSLASAGQSQDPDAQAPAGAASAQGGSPERAFARMLFQRVLRREAPAGELDHWEAVVRHHGPAAAMAMVFDSDEYAFRQGASGAGSPAAGGNPPRAFAETLFRRVLRREPSEAELAHWEEVVRHHGYAGALGLVLDSDEYAGRRASDAAAADLPVDAGQPRRFAETLFRRVLRRAPGEAELQDWEAVIRHHGYAGATDLLFESNEYVHRNRVNDASEFFPGHFYSPVVDPEELRERGFTVDHELEEERLHGIRLDPERMTAFFTRHAQRMNEWPFAASPSPDARYHAANDVYSMGDGDIVLAMMAEAQPRQVIEIGSGFSSAHMLDVADRMGLPTRFTFIEPYPERLYGLMRPGDRERCTVIERGVQAVDPALFDTLEPNDLLFIDSTHVSKAGSDVNHELFEVLPRLRPGVIVHFHDIFYPFDYPEAWTFGSRRSWNEAYLLRAFLMDNPRYEVLFFNHYFWVKRREVAARVPTFLQVSGSGLWLRKLAA